MELKFWLNNSLIDEPAGFDTFKSVIERTENHGVSAEVSFGTLEFYGPAYRVIKTAYNTDIDSELIFKVELKCSESGGFNEIYKGTIDLASYEESTGDYCSVKCRVGEVGVRTTFNNRADTQVYLNSLKSMDGEVLSVYPELEKLIVIPSKDIITTNYGKTSSVNGILLGSQVIRATIYEQLKLNIGWDIQDLSELGLLNSSHQIFREPQKWQDSSVFFENKYDIKKLKISYDLSVKIKFENSNIKWKSRIEFYRKDGTNEPVLIRAGVYSNEDASEKTISDSFSTEIFAEQTTKLLMFVGIQAICIGGSQYESSDVKLTIQEPNSNFINVNSLTSVESSKTKITLVHEAFSRISEIISGLKVKSDWFGRGNSNVNPVGGYRNVGKGALKCITNGLRLRNAVLTNGREPYLFLSFKELFNAMKAVDCVGWGFSTEDGTDCVRVEPFEWFYKNEHVLDVDDASEISRKFDAGNAITRLKIGYAKYAEIEKVNAVDNFHTERQYTRKIKAIDKQEEQLCKFIADPYAIEYTRRKSLDKTTEDWTYDNDIFLFTLKYGTADGNVYDFSIDTGMINTGRSVLSPETMTNVRISPARNARRWAKQLFKITSSRDNYEFASGVGNIDAGGQPVSVAGWKYCEDSNDILSEKSNIAYKSPILKSEIISFEFPLKIDEYVLIRSNPYGIIRVNGENCYLKRVEYSYMEGLAKFELIPAVS